MLSKIKSKTKLFVFILLYIGKMHIYFSGAVLFCNNVYKMDTNFKFICFALEISPKQHQTPKNDF